MRASSRGNISFSLVGCQSARQGCVVQQCQAERLNTHGCAAQVLKKRIPEYSPDFTAAFEHFCIHTVRACLFTRLFALCSELLSVSCKLVKRSASPPLAFPMFKNHSSANGAQICITTESLRSLQCSPGRLFIICSGNGFSVPDLHVSRQHALESACTFWQLHPPPHLLLNLKHENIIHRGERR